MGAAIASIGTAMIRPTRQVAVKRQRITEGSFTGAKSLRNALRRGHVLSYYSFSLEDGRECDRYTAAIFLTGN